MIDVNSGDQICTGRREVFFQSKLYPARVKTATFNNAVNLNWCSTRRELEKQPKKDAKVRVRDRHVGK